MSYHSEAIRIGQLLTASEILTSTFVLVVLLRIKMLESDAMSRYYKKIIFCY